MLSIPRKKEGAENRAVKLTEYLAKLPPRWVPVFISLLIAYWTFPGNLLLITLPFILLSSLRESLSYMMLLEMFLLFLGAHTPLPTAPYVAISWSILIVLLYLSLAFTPSTLTLFGPLLTYSIVFYHPLLTPLSWVLAIIFSLFFIFLVNKPSLLFLGMPLPKLLSAFLKSWLLHLKDLERELKKFSTKTTVEVNILELQDNQEKLQLVIPNIHFGPFGRIGSGRFPALAARKDRVVLHGTANHQLDFVEEEEAKALVDALESAERKAESTTLHYSMGREGAAKAHLLSFGTFGVAFLTRAPEVTEDITYGGGLKIQREKPYPISIVDLHNSEASVITYFDELSKEVEEYAKALSKAKEGKAVPFFFSHVIVPSISKAVGGAGIHLVAVKGNKEIAIVVIDSNGISLDCRNHIEKMGRTLGFDAVLVATTDTHEKNVERGVIHDYRCEDSKDIEKALEELKRRLMEKVKKRTTAKALFKTLNFPAKVVGSRKVVESLNVVLDSYTIARILLPFLLLMDAVLLHLFLLIFP